MAVTDFDECVAAGGKVQKQKPPVCFYKGKKFTGEDIGESKAVEKKEIKDNKKK